MGIRSSHGHESGRGLRRVIGQGHLGAAGRELRELSVAGSAGHGVSGITRQDAGVRVTTSIFNLNSDLI